MDTYTLDEFIKVKLKKGHSDFNIGTRYVNGEIHVDDKSPNRVSFKVRFRHPIPIWRRWAKGLGRRYCLMHNDQHEGQGKYDK